MEGSKAECGRVCSIQYFMLGVSFMTELNCSSYTLAGEIAQFPLQAHTINASGLHYSNIEIMCKMDEMCTQYCNSIFLCF